MDRAGLVSLLTLLWNVLEQDWHCTTHGEEGGQGPGSINIQCLIGTAPAALICRPSPLCRADISRAHIQL